MRSQIIPTDSGICEQENKAFHLKQWDYSGSVVIFIKYDKSPTKPERVFCSAGWSSKVLWFQHLLSFGFGITSSSLNLLFRGRQTSSSYGSPEPWESQVHWRDEPVWLSVSLLGLPQPQWTQRQCMGGIIISQKLFLLKQTNSKEPKINAMIKMFIIAHTSLDIIKGLHLFIAPLNEEHYSSVSG